MIQNKTCFTKINKFINMCMGDSYCSISAECLESGHDIFICLRDHAKVNI